jgi:hypothetical protein
MPNWPVLVTEWAAGYNSNGGAPVPTGQNVELSPRVLKAISSKRGKQYELDTAMAGELSTTLRNNDAALDPTNSAGPFAGHIMPYQPFQVRAQYPPTANLLPNVIATGGEGYTAGAIPASLGIWTGTDPGGTGSIVQPSDGGKQGTNCFQFAVSTVPNGTGQFVMSYSQAAAPLTTYTISMSFRNVTAATTGLAQLTIGYFGVPFAYGPQSWAYGGNVSAVGKASGATWYTTQMTVTTPAGCTGFAVGLSDAGSSGHAVWNCQIDAIQIEQGSTASAFVAPGTWYPLFSGFVERWPTEWGDSGTWGTLQPTITDSFALLSQGQLSDPLTEEINAAGCTWLYRLDDSQDSLTAAEANGNYPPLNQVSSNSGPGSVTFGNSITATDTVNGVFTAGATNPSVAAFVPASYASNGNSAATVLSLSGSGIKGPQNPGLFTRMLAFRTSVPQNGAGLACLNSYFTTLYEGSQYGGELVMQWNSATGLDVPGFIWTGQNGLGAPYFPFAVPSGFNPYDGNWHLVFWGINASAGIQFGCVDGATTGMTASVGSAVPPTNIAVDSIGSFFQANGWSQNAFEGDIAFVAEFPTQLTTTQIQNIYGAWKNACSGESSASRYARILRYAKYTGPTNIGTGLTSQMGPASDLDGSDALSCLNSVVTTENGTHFVAKDGTITFQGRNYRYNKPTPSFVFGENAAGGEFPYESLKLDYDTTHLAKDVTVTQSSTSQNFFATNPASMGNFFDRTMTRSVNVLNPQEAQDCANYLATRYGNPLTRVDTLTLNPAAQPALWPVILQLELGMCIQVNRRPPGCPEISLLLWLEQMSWDTDDKGNFTVSLQCSPANTVTQAQFGFWQAGIAAAASGQPVITVMNSIDNVNPLDAMLYPGQQLTIHSTPGVAVETRTISAVQSTGKNWSTGTVTFTTNLSASHPAGAIVSEYSSVNIGVDAFDANCVFDSAVFTY